MIDPIKPSAQEPVALTPCERSLYRGPVSIPWRGRERFEALLCGLFDEPSIRRWLRLGPDNDAISDLVPGPPIDPSFTRPPRNALPPGEAGIVNGTELEVTLRQVPSGA